MSSPPPVTDNGRYSSGQRAFAQNAAFGIVVAAATVIAAWSASGLDSTQLWWVTPISALIGAGFGVTIGPVRSAVRTPGILPIAIAGSAAAVYGCVPETDQMEAIGSFVAIVVAIELVRWKPLPAVWHAGSAALILWGGLFGATGRPSALIGTLFAAVPVPLLGMWLLVHPRLVAEAVGDGWRWVVLATGSVAALAMARTGGIEPDTPAGTATALRWLVVWTVAAVAVSGTAVWISAGRSRRLDPGP